MCIQNKLAYKFSPILSNLFVLQIFKDQKVLGVSPSEPGMRLETVAELVAHQDPHLHFYHIRKLNLCSKTDISKTA